MYKKTSRIPINKVEQALIIKINFKRSWDAHELPQHTENIRHNHRKDGRY